ncbi:hypothetical protein V8E53_008848 [Lactarius tabidus]
MQRGSHEVPQVATFLANLFRRSQDLYKPTFNHVKDRTAYRPRAFRTQDLIDASSISKPAHYSLGHGYGGIIRADHIRFVTSISPARPNNLCCPTNCTLRMAPHTTISSSNHSGIFFKFDVEPIRLTLIQHTATFTQSFIHCAGFIDYIFVRASWASAQHGSDDTGSIAPRDSARSGVLCSKWTGRTLRARSGSASLQPGVWAEAGSPYGSTYSGVSSYTSSSAGSPMFPSPCSPVTDPPPLSSRPGGVPGTPPGLGLSPGLFTLGIAAGGGMRTLAIVVTMGLGLIAPCFGNFPPRPRLPLNGPAASPTPRDTGKKDG